LHRGIVLGKRCQDAIRLWPLRPCRERHAAAPPMSVMTSRRPMQNVI
jgi:hypothetical protein